MLKITSIDPSRIKTFFTSVPGIRKTGIYLLVASISLAGFFILTGRSAELEKRLELKESRFNNLLELAEEYKVLAGKANTDSLSLEPQREPVNIISDLLGKLEIKNNLVQLSMTATGINLQLRDLYIEDLASLVENLGRNGLTINSAEIRAISVSEGRLLDMSLIVVKG